MTLSLSPQGTDCSIHEAWNNPVARARYDLMLLFTRFLCTPPTQSNLYLKLLVVSAATKYVKDQARRGVRHAAGIFWSKYRLAIRGMNDDVLSYSICSLNKVFFVYRTKYKVLDKDCLRYLVNSIWIRNNFLHNKEVTGRGRLTTYNAGARYNFINYFAFYFV